MPSAASSSADRPTLFRAGLVRAVSRDDRHRFSKQPQAEIRLVEGHGVDGDAHAGTTVQHLHPRRRHPERPNLRQVHLLDEEFLLEAAAHGFALGPGDLGENVLTSGIRLRDLPEGTHLTLGGTATVRVTGLRNPCRQIDDLRPGLLRLAVGRDADGAVVRRVGVMAVVTASGPVAAGRPITVRLPAAPHRPLQQV
jgi:MOSC domain-containing protein YiiM